MTHSPENAALWDQMSAAANAIRKVDERSPAVALVLGSGLGAYADTLENKTAIPYDQIPGFPSSTVAGHAGQLVIGEVDGLVVVAMQGRVHLYEGHGAQVITLPLRTLYLLGARTLIITNAAGGLNPDYVQGDLVALSDHLNLTGSNPLLGENFDELGLRFPDMTTAYDPELRKLAVKVARSQGLTLKSGVYAGLLGPSYETPAEVQMLSRIGADLVGMSTVCEVIAARHAGMRVLGISCVTNLAAGISKTELDHSEVKEVASLVRTTFQSLIDGVLKRLAGGRE